MSVDEVLKTQIADAKLELVNNTELTRDRKDTLLLKLCHAEAVSDGDLVSMGKALSFMILDSCRESMRGADLTKSLICDHETRCVLKQKPKTIKEFGMSIAAQYPVLTVIGLVWLGEKVGWDKLLGVVTSLFHTV